MTDGPFYSEGDLERMQAYCGRVPDMQITEEEVIPILMDAKDSYASAVQELRTTCLDDLLSAQPMIRGHSSDIVRPLTFRETIGVRVDDYNRLNNPDGTERNEKDRLRLFSTWLDSCTGIAYKGGETMKIKIIPLCESLVSIEWGFSKSHKHVDYDALPYPELDTALGGYNEGLTEAEVIEHPAWIGALEDDRHLLEEYARIIASKYKAGHTIMQFRRCTDTTAGELRHLFVSDLDFYSCAHSNSGLDENTRLIRMVRR